MTTKKKAGKSEKPDLAQKAYQGIRQMLFHNEIIPGQKIKYQDLADRIGVSITPVIHALKWLEFKNIVRHEPNRGCFVNEVSLKEIREIYECRLLLEVSLAPEIIRHLDDDGFRSLQQSLDDYNRAVIEDNYYNRLMTDMKFHLTLASLSQCQIQFKMLQELFDLLLLKYIRNLLLLGITDSSQQEHNRIISALTDLDLPGLQEALFTHLDNVRAHIVQGFKKVYVSKNESMVDLFTFNL
jgi:DNA-binding GntR family transcriptional regulator